MGNEITNDLKASLEALSIGDLRKKAVNNFGLKLTREYSKEDIVNLIIKVSQGTNFAQESSGELKPGWARIKIHKDRNSTQDMVFFNCNGYQALIPLGIEVDVPIKVLEILDHAEEMRITKLDDYGNPQWGMEISYPYTLLGKLDGPDPKPGYEVMRERKIAGKKKFFQKYGQYPTDKQYQAFVLSGQKFNPYDESTSDAE
jgi:hypothetical protein